MEDQEKLARLGKWVREHEVVELLEAARYQIEEARKREWEAAGGIELPDKPPLHITATSAMIRSALHYLKHYGYKRPTTLFEIFSQ